MQVLVCAPLLLFVFFAISAAAMSLTPLPPMLTALRCHYDAAADAASLHQARYIDADTP